MTQTRRQRAEELFQEAADLAPEKREAFLEDRCSQDPDLLQEVGRLLDRLEKGRIPSLGTVDEIREEAVARMEGERIGPYKVLQLIGECGFGAVYMAEQVEPIRRKVALKIIKLGMDTKQIIARFEAERQALAMMDHPHIARVFDAGATERGRPYFVMELVKGIPITEYCDLHNLSMRERLELFVQVCRAVQHAHQKGIIHRDLKPSNIMVTLHDGRPVPKVIDFGIARATDQPLTEKTVFTRFGQFIGTPQYMSPEQAAISGVDVDTRSDIFSLGVLLYELLTGTTPFDAKTLHNVGIGEIQRIISEEFPPTPSQRVSVLGSALTDIARTRRAEPRNLSRLIRGDLDWIVMKALEKDRQRRYETAGDLAADVERHLGAEPVLAGPPSRVYQFRKLVLRHKATFGFLAVLFVLVIGCSVWMALLYQRAEQLRLRAETERGTALRALDAEEKQRRLVDDSLTRAREAETRALAEAETAGRISDFLVELFELADPSRVRGETITVREILDRGAQRIQQELKNKPEIKATMMYTIGQAYMNLGLHQSAAPLLKDAYALRRESLGGEHPDTLHSMIYLGRLLMLERKLPESEALLRQALERCRRVLGADHLSTFKAVKYLAWVLQNQGHLEEAEPLSLEALETSRRLLGEDHRDTLGSMETLAWLYQAQGKLTEAEALSRRALDTSRRINGEEHPSTATSTNFLGVLLLRLGNRSEAKLLLRRALEIRMRVLGEDHTSTLDSQANLAEVLSEDGEMEEARHLYSRAIEGFGRVLGKGHRRTLQTQVGLALLLVKEGEFAQGETLLQESLEGLRRTLGREHPETLDLMRLLVTVLLDQKKSVEAEKLLRDYLEIQGRVSPGDTVDAAVAGCFLARSLFDQERFGEAETLLLENHPILSTGLGPGHDETLKAIDQLILLYDAWNRPDEAAKWRARRAESRRTP